MDWLSDAIPLILLGLVQMCLAFGIGLYLLRSVRGKDGGR